MEKLLIHFFEEYGILLLVFSLFALVFGIRYTRSHKTIKCKVNRRTENKFYYSHVKWDKRKENGYFFSTTRHRFVPLTKNNREIVRKAIMEGKTPEIFTS